MAEAEHAIKSEVLKKPKLERLDDDVWIWFCQERHKGTPLSGPIVKEKQCSYTKMGGKETEFTASEGWLWQ